MSLLATVLLAASVPATTPASTIPDVDVTPGVAGFVAIAAVGIATVFLLIDMTRRVRRTRYRSEIRERLEAEERGDVPDDAPDRHTGSTGTVRGTTDGGRADVGDDTERG